MKKQEPSLFVATPLHTPVVHLAWASGCLKATVAFAGRIAVQTNVGSLLPRNRDILTAMFMKSGASHMLCVDSDIGWTPEDANALLATGKDFVSGTYCKKQEDHGLPVGLNGEKQEGQHLFSAEWVPGGFLLLSRACLERMFGAYRFLDYDQAPWGSLCGLWSARPESPNAGEDVAFCRRWREIGGDIWLHRGVVLGHFDGGTEYRPTEDSKPTFVGDAAPPEPKGATAPEVKPANPAKSPSFPGAMLKMRGSLPVHVHGGAS